MLVKIVHLIFWFFIFYITLDTTENEKNLSITCTMTTAKKKIITICNTYIGS